MPVHFLHFIILNDISRNMTSAVLLYIFSSIYVGLNVLDIALAQFAGCDYKININKDVSHSINSPLYANYYKPNTNCRWDVTAPAGYSVHLNCVGISLPSVSIHSIIIKKYVVRN